MYKHIVSAFCFFFPFFRLRRHGGRLLAFLALGLSQLQLPFLALIDILSLTCRVWWPL